MTSDIKIFGIVEESIVDGPGIRYSIFFQGCIHNCKGCHNPDSHDVNAGKWKSISEIISEINSNPLLAGVTITGGEPFLQKEKLLELVRRIKKDTDKNIYIYTGYLYEDLLKDKLACEILNIADVLIDGPFIEGEKDLELIFRGSRNQRIIEL